MMKRFFTKNISIAYAAILAILVFSPQADAQWIFEVTSPASIAGKYGMGTATYGAMPQDTTFGRLRIGRDATANPTFACESLVTDLSGFIGVVDRGECPFVDKVLNAQAANASAVVICNNRDEIINLTGTAPAVTVQTMLLRQSDCDKIKAVLSSQDVSVKIYRQTQATVWSFDFSNFDGWTGTGANGDLWYRSTPIASTAIPAGWAAAGGRYDYQLHPSGKYPRFYGTTTDRRILSQTVDNGFAMIDSDAWNNSSDGTFQQNPPEARLVSPPIDVSGSAGVPLALTFTHALRFCCSGATGQFTVDVSTNGFNTFVTFDAQAGQAANAISRNATPIYNLTQVLTPGADLTNLQIRFNFSGVSSHYFWMIDDIALVELPETNIQMQNAFNPVFSFGTPKEFIYADTFAFGFNLRNLGLAQPLIESKVRVVNATTNAVVFEETLNVQNIPSAVDTFLEFSGRFSPALPPGDYIISYSTEAPGKIDFNYGDNFASFAFRSTNNIYSKDNPDASTFTRSVWQSAEARWAWGNIYYIAPVANPNVVTTFAGSQHAFIAENGTFNPNSDDIIIVYLMEFNTPGFLGGYFAEIQSDLSAWVTDHPALTQRAYAFIDNERLAQVGSGNLFTLEMGDFFDAATNVELDPVDNPLNLNPNKLYLLTTAIVNSNSPNVRMATSNAVIYSVPTGLLWTQGRNWTGFTGDDEPIARMLLNIRDITSTNDVTTVKPVKAYPVPASDKVFMNFGFEQPTDIEVQMFDMDGRMVNSRKHSSVQSEDVATDVSEINTGNYIIKVISKDGIMTSKVIIIK